MDIDKLHDYVTGSITGRIGMLHSESELLARTVAGSKTHLEFGTMWGGTAILAALAGAKRVYSIDVMSGGWWDVGQDPKVNAPLGPKAVIDNIAGLKLQDRVTLVIGLSAPFPLAGLEFDSVLIDGGHTFEVVQADWNNVQAVTKDYIIFHDYDDGHPGVKKFLDSKQPEKDGWMLHKSVETLRVYARKVESEKLVAESKEAKITDESSIPNDSHAHHPPARPVSSRKPAKPGTAKRP